MKWLDLIFRLMDLALDWAKASADTKEQFKKLVQAAKDDGLISIQAKDKFKELDERLERGEGK